MPRATAPTDWAACERELAAGAAALGLELGTGVRARLLDYLAELANWNATHNLTAVREPRAMVARHLLDSLAVLEAVTGPRLADVGTGAGLPGLVIALARPEIAVTLIESSAKKAAFLRHVRRRLQLANVEVVRARVEAHAPATGFDCVICRAFAAADDCLRLAGHLVGPGGRFLLMKGRDPVAELGALPPAFRHRETRALTVPGLDAARHLVVLEPVRA
ncbi:16S rRNA (guanine(527)-N(7))-methyltransferase RsmG [Salinisphaera orenii]|uniref:Ribosomal RNA small subunit methyltransferase G n=1 Tax=Salinisphaera orenii YIM 95161 TaxID=1051139 RepID=A0A423Q2S4_9GAMM|nr:16S rRNA (guanine(527)-N(7))-methyltransferase RsmG [Salinisphaera halophila]ROO32971.1 16S rRNA methyltransferase [Salinisphaera halophila YIM 95161]